MFKVFTLLVLSLSTVPAFASDGNQIQVINHAVASFQKRFEMIERAEKSIDIEYFIYNTDEAGRLFTQALIKKKKQNPNIVIRLLVDASQTVLELSPGYVYVMEKMGIQVRLYNTANVFTQFALAQYRDHRKLLLIDGKEAITGSRNIADEYFDMDREFNFTDRDIWVKGPVVQQMKKEFDSYWKHEMSVPSEKPSRISVGDMKDVIAAVDFVKENWHDKYMRTEIKRVGTPILVDQNSMGECDSLTSVTDKPGISVPSKRKVLPAIFSRMNDLNKGDKFFVESPYFIVKDTAALKQMAGLKAKEVEAVLLTNSLASTDAFYVAANFYPQTSFYQSLTKSHMYIYSGKVPSMSMIKESNGNVLAKDAVFGIHAKTFVFNDTDFAIGTFNVDPRSANLNAEMMLICKGSQKLTKFVLADMESRIDDSYLLRRDGRLQNGNSIFDGVDFMKKMKFFLAIKPSEWFADLL